MSDERQFLLDAALRMLARRDYSVRELRTKLKQKVAARNSQRQPTSQTLNSVIHWLIAQGYLDDGRVATSHARRGRVARRQGDTRIRRDLKRRGIDATIVDSVLAELPDSEEALEAALASYVSLRGSLEGREALQRCYRYLLRLGHPPSRIRQALAPFFRKQGGSRQLNAGSRKR